jgi:protein subunit release factor A
MAEAPSAHDFDCHVESQLSKLFGPDELEVLVHRSEGPGGLGTRTTDSAVMVIHLPTGKEVMCFEYQTQIRNKVACLLTLLLDTPRSS